MDDLKHKVVDSLKWVGGTTFIVQLFSWGSTIYVIRRLTPADLGLVGIAFIFIGTFALISELGLGQAVIQKEQITTFQLRQVMGFVVLGNLFFFSLLSITAPYIAVFYHEVRLESIVRILSLIFLIRPLYVIQETLIAKKMDFKTKSIVNLIANLSASLTALILAVTGFGFWALVWNQLVLYIVRAVGFNVLGEKIIWPTLKLKGASALLSFGGYATGASLFRALYYKLDVMIAGRFFPIIQIGYYSVAMQLSSMVLEKIAVVVPQIAFPAFSTLQSDPERFSLGFLKSVWVLHLVSIPCFIGIGAIAPEVVHVFLGEKWHAVVVPMQLLCLMMPLRMFDVLYYPSMNAKGRADINMATAAFATIVLGVGFFVGISWGVTGLCWTWGIVYPVIYCYMLFNCKKILDTDVKEILKTFLIPVIASVVMFFMIMQVRVAVSNHVSKLPQLIILLSVGLVVVPIVMLCLDKKLVAKLKNK